MHSTDLVYIAELLIKMITVPTEKKTYFICFISAKLQDTAIMTDDNVCNKLSQDLLHFNLDRKDDGLSNDLLEEDRIILQPSTALERHLVSTSIRYYYIMESYRSWLEVGPSWVYNLLALNLTMFNTF